MNTKNPVAEEPAVNGTSNEPGTSAGGGPLNGGVPAAIAAGAFTVSPAEGGQTVPHSVPMMGQNLFGFGNPNLPVVN